LRRCPVDTISEGDGVSFLDATDGIMVGKTEMLSFAAEVQFDRNKFSEVVLFIILNCASDRLGAIKLHKILYFSDMLTFAFEGHPLTGSVYRKRPHGPTSDHLLSVLRDLQRNDSIRVSNVDYFGFRKTSYQLLREPTITLLNETEKRLLLDVADFVANQNTAKTISEFSHNRAWEIAEFGAAIPYYTAFALFPTEVSTETVEWATSMAGEIEAEKSQRSSLDYESFNDFRGRILAH
jgi:hypothetical protein